VRKGKLRPDVRAGSSERIVLTFMYWGPCTLACRLSAPRGRLRSAVRGRSSMGATEAWAVTAGALASWAVVLVRGLLVSTSARRGLAPCVGTQRRVGPMLRTRLLAHSTPFLGWRHHSPSCRPRTLVVGAVDVTSPTINEDTFAADKCGVKDPPRWQTVPPRGVNEAAGRTLRACGGRGMVGGAERMSHQRIGEHMAQTSLYPVARQWEPAHAWT